MKTTPFLLELGLQENIKCHEIHDKKHSFGKTLKEGVEFDFFFFCLFGAFSCFDFCGIFCLFGIFCGFVFGFWVFLFCLLIFWGVLFVFVLCWFFCLLFGFWWFGWVFFLFVSFSFYLVWFVFFVLSEMVLFYFHVLLTAMETILDNHLVPGLLSFWWKDVLLSAAFSWNRLLLVTQTWLLSQFLLLPIVTQPGIKAQLCFGSVGCHWWTDLITH